MLKRGFLAGNLVSISDAHNFKIIKKYRKALKEVFNKISEIMITKKKFPLLGPVKHSTFKRLTD